MMLTVSYTSLCNNMKSYMYIVTDDYETMIITKSAALSGANAAVEECRKNFLAKQIRTSYNN